MPPRGVVACQDMDMACQTGTKAQPPPLRGACAPEGGTAPRAARVARVWGWPGGVPACAQEQGRRCSWRRPLRSTSQCQAWRGESLGGQSGAPIVVGSSSALGVHPPRRRPRPTAAGPRGGAGSLGAHAQTHSVLTIISSRPGVPGSWCASAIHAPRGAAPTSPVAPPHLQGGAGGAGGACAARRRCRRGLHC